MGGFLPYYEEIKLAGHCGYAFVATFFGGFGIYLTSSVSGAKFPFDRCFSFSLFAAAAVWVAPFLGFVPGDAEEWVVFGLLWAAWPVLAFLSRSGFKASLALWLGFAASQALLFGLLRWIVGV